MILWISLLMIMTVITEWLAEDVPPSWKAELARVIIHASGFAILAITALWAVRRVGREALPVIIGIALATGLGQETLQSLMRGRLDLAGSLFDLGVDMSGAFIGFRVHHLITGRGAGKIQDRDDLY